MYLLMTGAIQPMPPGKTFWLLCSQEAWTYPLLDPKFYHLIPALTLVLLRGQRFRRLVTHMETTAASYRHQEVLQVSLASQNISTAMFQQPLPKEEKARE